MPLPPVFPPSPTAEADGIGQHGNQRESVDGSKEKGHENQRECEEGRKSRKESHWNGSLGAAGSDPPRVSRLGTADGDQQRAAVQPPGPGRLVRQGEAPGHHRARSHPRVHGGDDHALHPPRGVGLRRARARRDDSGDARRRRRAVVDRVPFSDPGRRPRTDDERNRASRWSGTGPRRGDPRFSPRQPGWRSDPPPPVSG